MDRRKSDLSEKLQQLKRETDLSMKLVMLLFEDTQKNLVEKTIQANDPKVFLQQYPAITAQLSERLSHFVQFNCMTETLLENAKSTPLTLDEQTAANNATIPTPQHQILSSSSPSPSVELSSLAVQTPAMTTSTILHGNPLPVTNNPSINGPERLNCADDIKWLSLLDKSVVKKELLTIQVAGTHVKIEAPEEPSTSAADTEEPRILEENHVPPLPSSPIQETASLVQSPSNGTQLDTNPRPEPQTDAMLTSETSQEPSSPLQSCIEEPGTQFTSDTPVSRTEDTPIVQVDSTFDSEVNDLPTTSLVSASSAECSLLQSSTDVSVKHSPPIPPISKAHEEKLNTSLMSNSNKDQSQSKLQDKPSASSADLTTNAGSALPSRQPSKEIKFVPYCVEKFGKKSFTKGTPQSPSREKPSSSLAIVNLPPSQPIAVTQTSVLPTPRAARANPPVEEPEQPLKSGGRSLKNKEPFLGFERNAAEFQDAWLGILEANAIESPSEFYVHIASPENATIDEFHEKVQTYYNDTECKFISKYEAKEGLSNFCACYCPEREGWYRGQVLDWCWDEDEVLVQLVDYGSKYKAALKNLRHLHDDLKLKPLLATRCHLAFTKPPSNKPTWHQASINMFKAVCGKYWAYEIIPLGWVEMSTSDSPIPLNFNHSKSASVLLIPNTAGKINVNDTMISLGYAESDDPNKNCVKESKDNIHSLPNSNDKVLDWFHRSSSASSEASRVKSTETSSVKSTKPSSVKSTKPSSVKSRPISSVPNDSRVKITKDSTGKSMDVASQNRVNSTLVAASSSAPLDKDPLDWWNPMEEAFENPDYDDENVCVAVSGYEATDESRICRFFASTGKCYKGASCQKEHTHMHPDGYTTDKELVFCRAFNELPVLAIDSVMYLEVTVVSPSNNFFYAIDPTFSHDGESLLSLACSLNNPMNIRNFKRHQITPALMQIVLARYDCDGRWYRAQVVDSCSDSGMVTVFFGDYGNTVTVMQKYVREIDARFLHLPFQARQFSLANVELYKDRLAEAAQFFLSIVTGKTLFAYITEFNGVLDVYRCTLSDDSTDIGFMLVENGFGEIIHPTDHSQVLGRICYENNVFGCRYFPG